jgi:subtilase family serine protease
MARRARAVGRHGAGPATWLLVALLAVAATLAACAPSAAPSAAVRTSRAALRDLGPTPAARTIRITLVLRGKSSSDLSQLLAGLDDPHSPNYHHYLSASAFADQFGASAQVRSLVAATLASAGLSVVGQSSDGLLVTAQGTVGAVESLFGVRVHDFRTAAGQRVYAALGQPRMPPSFGDAVSGVLGLESVSSAHPADMARAAQVNGNGLSPSDVRQAYNIGPLINSGLDGSGETVAMAEIDTFKQSDIDTYDNAYGLQSSPVQVVQVGGGAAAPDQMSETTLDIEVLHAIAPKAQLIAYEGGSDNTGLIQTFSRIVSDHRVQIVSISLGLCERFILDPSQAPRDLQSSLNTSGQAYFSALDNVFQEADALGMSVLVASGDTGAYGCNQLDPNNHEVVPSSPATSPYVTAVGGTTLFTNSNGTYGHEAGWEGPLQGAGSGGGLSLQYGRPNWQTGPGVDNTASNGMRQVPDVSSNADPLTGYAIYDSTANCSGSDCWGVVGGTSAAAPMWAGVVALADQAAGQRKLRPLGFLDPALYSLGAGASAGTLYHDVTIGGNLYYPATPGWDFSTGIGTPDAGALAQALVALDSGT